MCYANLKNLPYRDKYDVMGKCDTKNNKLLIKLPEKKENQTIWPTTASTVH